MSNDMESNDIVIALEWNDDVVALEWNDDVIAFHVIGHGMRNQNDASCHWTWSFGVHPLEMSNDLEWNDMVIRCPMDSFRLK